MAYFSFITWNVDPDFINAGGIPIRWYGLLYAAAFIIGYRYLRKTYKSEHLNRKEVDRLTWHLIPGILIGARLGYMLIHWHLASGTYFHDYWSHPFDVFIVWHGRLSAYGGALGILLAVFIYTRRGPVQSFMHVMDLLVVPITIGAIFVRIGNLMNSGLYGRETDMPWGFKFVKDAVNAGVPFSKVKPHHPVQIYEIIMLSLMLILLLRYKNRKAENLKTGILSGIFMVCIFFIRFIIECFKDPQMGFKLNIFSGFGLDIGQLISLFFIVAGIWIILYRSHRQRPEAAG